MIVTGFAEESVSRVAKRIPVPAFCTQPVGRFQVGFASGDFSICTLFKKVSNVGRSDSIRTDGPTTLKNQTRPDWRIIATSIRSLFVAVLAAIGFVVFGTRYRSIFALSRQPPRPQQSRQNMANAKWVETIERFRMTESTWGGAWVGGSQITRTITRLAIQWCSCKTPADGSHHYISGRPS